MQTIITSHFVPVKNGSITCFRKNSGNNKAIIVLHGGPGLGCDYLASFFDGISNEYDIITYDQRGCGESFDCEVSESSITLPQFVEDLNAIRTYFQYETVGLIGHSFGGLVAMKYAMDHSVDFLGLVNSASATSLGLMQFEMKRRFTTQKDIFKKIAPSLFKKVSYVYPHTITEESKRVFKLFERTFFSKWYDFRTNLQKITIPTFIAFGEHDFMPMWAMKELYSCFQTSELHIIRNSGHYTFLDQKEAFFLKLNNFLKEKNHHFYKRKAKFSTFRNFL